jgi:hypothetical protein
MTDLSILRQAQGARLTAACARELERYVEGLFAHPRMISPNRAEVPVIGGDYFVESPDRHKAAVCAALISRQRFRHDAPGWPELPLHEDCCEQMRGCCDHRRSLVGHYACSLSDLSWDYELHPRFATFARGLMAYESMPARLRDDPELRRELPPRPLEGLCDGRLTWRTTARIAADRDMRRRVAEAEAAWRAG